MGSERRSSVSGDVLPLSDRLRCSTRRNSGADPSTATMPYVHQRDSLLIRKSRCSAGSIVNRTFFQKSVLCAVVRAGLDLESDRIAKIQLRFGPAVELHDDLPLPAIGSTRAAERHQGTQVVQLRARDVRCPSDSFRFGRQAAIRHKSQCRKSSISVYRVQPH